MSGRANNQMPRPLTVGADGLAALLDISVRQVRKMNAMGQLPHPRRFGRRVVWSIEEIEEWVRAGCPSREAWQSVQMETKR